MKEETVYQPNLSYDDVMFIIETLEARSRVFETWEKHASLRGDMEEVSYAATGAYRSTLLAEALGQMIKSHNRS